MAIDLGRNSTSNSNEPVSEDAPLELAEVPAVVEIVEPTAEHIPGLQKMGVNSAIDEGRDAYLKEYSGEVVERLVNLDVNSPEFREGVKDINELAQDSMMDIGQVSSSLLQRRMKDMSDGKDNAQDKVSKTLLGLENTIEDINGSSSFMGKILRVLPGGSKVDGMMKRFQTAQDTLSNIQNALVEGSLSLEEDNIELANYQDNLRDSAMNLVEYIRFVDNAKVRLDAEIAQLKASSDPTDRERAVELEASAMFAIQQRRQDLRSQLAIAIQSFATMEMVRQNNVELIKGVKRTRATTMAALHTAVIVSNALQQQRQVVETNQAVTKMTESLMDDNSKTLQQNTLAIQEAAVSATIDPAVIQRSLQALENTAKAVREHQAKAIVVQEKSIQNIDAAIGSSEKAMRAIGSATVSGSNRELRK